MQKMSQSILEKCKNISFVLPTNLTWKVVFIILWIL